MGKLVLYLPDGTMHDIPLDKERLTIGRRPDNDVCLPYPAVSGEHAAVVNILDDSFLEDLGSTNGTLVNGKPIAKHFLRDNDLVDIGRQRLVYFSDASAKADPLPPEIRRRDIAELHEQVERVRAVRTEERLKAPLAAPGASGPRTVDPLMPDDELLADLDIASFPGDKKVVPHGPVPVERRAVEPRASAATSRAPRRQDPSAVAARLAATWSDMPARAVASAHADEPGSPSAARGSYALRVLTGPSAGRELAMTRDECSVGSVGTQVARIAQDDGGWRLARIEGDEPLVLNGAAVPDEGVAIEPGDRFVVAGVELAFERR
ncbi:MAG TPA: FHA domain-containing protein [Casimicrobiaceae bacterium]|jgi:hypothetical protein